MTPSQKNEIINSTSYKTIPASYTLKELSLKYYDTFESIMDDLAQKCAGGEEYSLNFSGGKITIKLR